MTSSLARDGFIQSADLALWPCPIIKTNVRVAPLYLLVLFPYDTFAFQRDYSSTRAQERIAQYETCVLEASKIAMRKHLFLQPPSQ